MIKYIVTLVLTVFLHSFSIGQTSVSVKRFKIDSIYGYNTIKIETSYSSLKNILSKKQTLNAHEYSCLMVDSLYLRCEAFKIQTMTIYFFDNKIRDIRIEIKDSINVKGVLGELKKTYGLENYSNDYNRNIWFGNSISLNYTVDSAYNWGVISFRSKNMECYVSTILKDSYWDDKNDEDGIHCPRINPCDE